MADLQQAFAQRLLAILQCNVEQAARLQTRLLPQTRHQTALQTINAGSRRKITAASPVAPDLP